jgi:hypothetical protein
MLHTNSKLYLFTDGRHNFSEGINNSGLRDVVIGVIGDEETTSSVPLAELQTPMLKKSAIFAITNCCFQ